MKRKKINEKTNEKKMSRSENDENIDAEKIPKNVQDEEERKCEMRRENEQIKLKK